MILQIIKRKALETISGHRSRIPISKLRKRDAWTTNRGKMKQKNHVSMQHYLSKAGQRELQDEKKAIVPFEMAQIGNDVIVPFEMTQIPNVLFATGWTNHQIIMNRCKTDSERLFYML